MPKTTRRYPTEKKTSTKNGKRSYMRLYMRDRRRKKSKNTPINELRKVHNELDVQAEAILQKHLLNLEKSPEFQNFSSQDQAKMKQLFMQIKQRVMESIRDVNDRLEEYYREFKMQLPVVIQKIYRDAYVEVEKERQQLVEKEMKRIMESLTDDQMFELWKLLQTGRLAEKFLKSSVKEISVTRREKRKHE